MHPKEPLAVSNGFYLKLLLELMNAVSNKSSLFLSVREHKVTHKEPAGDSIPYGNAWFLRNFSEAKFSESISESLLPEQRRTP